MGFGKLLAIACLFRSNVFGARIKHSGGSSSENSTWRSSDSCAKNGCSYIPGKTCQCNHECDLPQYKSCCSDKVQVCGSAPAPTPAPPLAFPSMPTTSLPPQYATLKNLKGPLNRWAGINHVAAYIIVEPANPGGETKIVIQNPAAMGMKKGPGGKLVPAPGESYQALGGYKVPQNLPYKIAALRSEIYDEGNVLITDENLIRASPFYVKEKAGSALGPVLLQVFYLREGPWLSEIGSNEFGARGQFTADIVKALPLEDIENKVHWRDVDVLSFRWLKELGAIEAIQDKEKTEALWAKGALQGSSKLPRGFDNLRNAANAPDIAKQLRYVATTPWWPPEKKTMNANLCC